MNAIQMLKLVLVGAVTLGFSSVWADSVSVNTSEELATAVANAQVGDVITLAKGTYEVPGKALVISNITLKGATGNPADVIVKRRSNESNSVYYRNVELLGDETVLQDLTVEGGRNNASGGNVYMAKGLIDHCIIRKGVMTAQAGGGGLYMTGGRITRSVVSNNWVSTGSNYYRGGGISMAGGQVDNCLVCGNTAYRGSGIVFAGSGNKIYNCTVVANTGTLDVGIEKEIWNGGSKAEIYNCVIADNIVSGYSTDINKISNYATGMKGCLTRVYLSDANNCGAFVFKDAANADYRLLVGSSGIDSALTQDVGWTTDDKDLLGSSRVVNGIVDAGCYEWNATSAGTEILANSDKTSGAIPLTVAFTAHTAGIDGEKAYDWDFGDGATSTEQNPSHTYESAGAYTVTLKVNGTDAANTITVIARGSQIEVDGTGFTLAEAVEACLDGGVIVLKASGSPYALDGEVLVERAMTIRGETGKPEDVVVTRNTEKGKFRLFHINHAGILLHSLTLEKGCNPGNSYYGGNILIDSNGGVVSNCVIRSGSNTGWSGNYGGGISANGSSARITRCVITNNAGSTASSYIGGGGVHLNGATIDNCLVAHNTGSWGAGITAQQGAIIYNCTIVDNKGAVGGTGVHFLWNRSPRIYNTIIARNTYTPDLENKQLCVFNTDYGSIDYFFNCVSPELDMSSKNDNIYGTPNFSDVTKDDYTTTKNSCNVAKGNDRKSMYSAASLDLAGLSRLYDDGTFDIGCYQWNPATAVKEVMAEQDVTSGAIPFDVSFTGKVSGFTGEVAYSWDFGDGETSTELNPTHTYTKIGTYTVSFKVISEGVDYPSSTTPTVAARSSQVILDGTTGVTLEQAIDLCVDGGEIVLKPEGSPYVVSNEVYVARPMTIRGETGNPDDVIVTRDMQATKHRIFRLNDAGVLLHSVTVEKGACPGNDYKGSNINIDENGGTVSNCVVRSGNNAGYSNNYGGGIAVCSASGYVTRCVVTNNTGSSANAYTGGSGIFMSAGRIDNCLIAHNTGSWGALGMQGSSKAYNCTIADNKASVGSAGVHFIWANSPRIYNCVIARNTGTTDQLCVFNLDCGDASQVYGKAEWFFNCTADKVDMSSVNSNVYGTPDFTNPDASDYTTSKTSCNVGIGSNTYAQYGEDALDLAGNSRFDTDGTKIDAGCYQWCLAKGAVEASFALDKALGILPLTVTFTPSVEGVAAGDHYVCQWDLDGDGLYETETQDAATAQMTYETAGTYNVAMRVVYKEVTTAAGATKSVRAYPREVVVSDEVDVFMALEAAGPGSTVILPAGEYKTTKTIAVGVGITLKGATGKADDVIIQRTSSGQALKVDGAGAFATGITVAKTSFSGGQDDPGVVQIGINGGTISNCVMRNCSGWSNGGVILAVRNADALVTHCAIYSNTVDQTQIWGYWSGPTVYLAGGTLADSLVAQNRGGGTYTTQADCGLGGVFLMGGSKVVRCTVADNEADRCAGIYVMNGKVYDSVVSGGQVTEGYNPARGTSDQINFVNCVCDTEKFNDTCWKSDPLYKDAANLKYWPTAQSPLINKGSSQDLPAVDLRGRKRLVGCAVDIGCYENQSAGFAIIVR